MGRSQRHLREFQHYDSGGYDHWRNATPPWVPANARLFMDQVAKRYWLVDGGGGSSDFTGEPVVGGFALDPGVVQALYPPFTILCEFEHGLDITEPTVQMLDLYDDEETALTLYVWGGDLNFYDGRDGQDIYSGESLVGRNRMVVTLDKFGVGATMRISGNGAAVASSTGQVLNTATSGALFNRGKGDDPGYRLLNMTVFPFVTPAGELPGLSAL